MTFAVKKHDRSSPKSSLSFGSTYKPRDMAMGNATYKGNHLPLSINDYSKRAPPPLSSAIYGKHAAGKGRRGGTTNPPPFENNRLVGNSITTHNATRDSNERERQRRRNYDSRISNSSKRYHANANDKIDHITTGNSDLFVADFSLIERNRARGSCVARHENAASSLRGGRVGSSGSADAPSVLMSPVLAYRDDKDELVAAAGPLSGRWHALSRSLWLAIVVETLQTNEESLKSYLQVLQWRAVGQVDEAEMTLLTNIYVSKSVASSSNFVEESMQSIDDKGLSLSPKRRAAHHGSPSSPSASSANARSPQRGSSSPKRVKVVGLRRFRDILGLELDFSEEDLDIFVALVINEHNKRLVNLNRVSPKWLTACETLFFLLDKHGHGSISVDEVCAFTRCIMINSLRKKFGSGVPVDELGWVASSLDSSAKNFLHDMAMESSGTTSRGLVRGTVTLASFKAFCLRNALSDNDLRECSKVLTCLHAGGEPWREAVEEVLQESPHEAGAPLGSCLVTDLAHRVGTIRFAQFIKNANDEELKKFLSSIASELCETLSRVLVGHESSSLPSSSPGRNSRLINDCLIAYVEKVRAWNKDFAADASAAGRVVAADISLLFPSLRKFLPSAEEEAMIKAQDGAKGPRGKGATNRPSSSQLTSVEEGATGVGNRFGRRHNLSANVYFESSVLAEAPRSTANTPASMRLDLTPISSQNESLRNIHVVESEGLPPKDDANSRPTFKQHHFTRLQAPPPSHKDRPVMPAGPTKPVLVYDGELTMRPGLRDKEAAKLAEHLLAANWESVFVNSDLPTEEEVMQTAFNFRGDGHVEFGASNTLEGLVDTLLATNNLEILDQIRAVRESKSHHAVNTDIPALSPGLRSSEPLSPRTIQIKKGRRGSELLSALRVMTPRPGGEGGEHHGLEPIWKIGQDMLSEDSVKVHVDKLPGSLREMENDGTHRKPKAVTRSTTA